MTDHCKNLLPLPTLSFLGAKLPKDTSSIDALSIAKAWFSRFSDIITNQDIQSLPSISLETFFWKDTLAMTWDSRTFESFPRVQKFLTDVLPNLGMTNLVLDEASVKFHQLFPDLAFIEGFFSFETPHVNASGVFRIFPPKEGEEEGGWKLHHIHTNLESIKGYPEHVGANRPVLPNGGSWCAQREKESSFAGDGEEPTVVVIGGGQSGLMTAARLKVLGISCLVLEKLPRLGDQWRGRYDTLWLHDTAYTQEFPYFPFPSCWSMFSSAPKYAQWLEIYAQALELNVWTGVTVTSISQSPLFSSPNSPADKHKVQWTVQLTLPSGSTRTLKPRHIVMAAGFKGGVPSIPTFGGEEDFIGGGGRILHSGEFRSADEWKSEGEGKKVLVVGAGVSGHDVCQTLAENGVDVTMYQRSSTFVMSQKNGIPLLFGQVYKAGGPPVDVADRILNSFPRRYLFGLHVRLMQVLSQMDRELLDGLAKAGFKHNPGENGTGVFPLILEKHGSYYPDIGASQLIISGKIKLKNDAKIEKFVKGGVKFDDGSVVEADGVILATGWTDSRDSAHPLLTPSLSSKLLPVWGVNDEIETNSAGRFSGVEGLYFVMGNVMMCRHFSKGIALQINAVEAGVMGERYTARLEV